MPNHTTYTSAPGSFVVYDGCCCCRRQRCRWWVIVVARTGTPVIKTLCGPEASAARRRGRRHRVDSPALRAACRRTSRSASGLDLDAHAVGVVTSPRARQRPRRVVARRCHARQRLVPRVFRCERAWELPDPATAAGSAGRGGRVATVTQWCDASVATDAAKWLASDWPAHDQARWAPASRAPSESALASVNQRRGLMMLHYAPDFQRAGCKARHTVSYQ